MCKPTKPLLTQPVVERAEREIRRVLATHGIVGASVAVLTGDGPAAVPIAVGDAVRGTGLQHTTRMTSESWLQYASLSKTVGTVFALETFRDSGIDPRKQRVNAHLRSLGSPWLLKTRSPSSEKNDNNKRRRDEEDDWAERVTLMQLCNHTALGLHYVPGVDPECDVPSALEMLNGDAEDFGYPALFVEREPGVSFKYSGGGFLVLEHILELMLGEDVLHALKFYALRVIGCDENDIAFDDTVLEERSADGYRDDGEPIPHRGGLVFPPIAAGGRGTAVALAAFLWHLCAAYHAEKTESSTLKISRETARLALGGDDDDILVDKGAMEFMRAKAGLGVFVGTTPRGHKFALHQAANDGFRGLYLVRFDGPDADAKRPKGFVVLTNGDNRAVLANVDIAKHLLTVLDLATFDDDDAQKTSSFDSKDIPQEQIVNLGYKELLFNDLFSKSGEEGK